MNETYATDETYEGRLTLALRMGRVGTMGQMGRKVGTGFKISIGRTGHAFRTVRRGSTLRMSRIGHIGLIR